jgi:hypothetical protein
MPAEAVAMRMGMRQCVERSKINLGVCAGFPRYLTGLTRKYCRERKEISYCLMEAGFCLLFDVTCL